MSSLPSVSIPTLYYSQETCAASCVIAAWIADVKVDLVQVSARKHVTANGTDFYNINPKGNLPTLVFPDGVRLTEASTILQWIADQAPSSKLAPANGTIERYLLQNHLNFIASELHAVHVPFFNPLCVGAAREAQKALVCKKYEYVQNHILKDNKYVMGDQFTIADIYLYVVLSWHSYLELSLDEYPTLKQRYEHMKALDCIKSGQEKMAQLAVTI